MPTLRRKPVDLQAWHLVGLTEMAEAFATMTAQGWRGGITSSGGQTRLELNQNDSDRQIIASVGDWLVLDMELRKMTAEQMAANYIEAGS